MAEKGKTVSWITFNDGENVDVSAADVESYIKNAGAGGGLLGDEIVEVTPLGGGLARFDFHLEAIEAGNYFEFEGVGIPVAVDPNSLDALRADVPYFANMRPSLSAKETLGAELWTCDQDALVVGDDAEWLAYDVPLTVEETGEEARADTVYMWEDGEDGTVIEHTLGEAGLDPDRLCGFYNTTAGRALTFQDAMGGLLILQASMGVAMRMREKRTEANAITVRYGAVVAQLARAATRRNKPKSVTLKNRKGEVVVKVTGIEDALTLNASSRKTFTLLDREATRLSMSGEYRHDRETVCRVTLSVSEIASLYGITERSAKNRLRRDFKAIANESLTFERGKGWVTIPVAGGAFGIRGDKATFTFSPDVMQLVLNPTAPQVDFPPELYGTDDTNFPAAFQIGAKLYAHDNQNFGRANQERMKLTTLLDAARELPTADEIERGRHSKTKRIMGPFEETMGHLVTMGVLSDWDYCHEKGEPLTPDEYRIIETEHDLGRPTPWELAEGLLVTWELGRRYPLHEAARQESRDRRITEATEERAKREKELKARERRIRGKVETMEAKRRFNQQHETAESR